MKKEDYSKLNDHEKKALENFENMFGMEKGSATLADVKETTAGIDGFANMG